MATVFLYTHSDMSDVWKPFFSRLRKHASLNWNVVVASDSFDVSSNDVMGMDISHIQYDDALAYTDRLRNSLERAKSSGFISDTILFIHEDMILYGDVNCSVIDDLICQVDTKKFDSIKLIWASDVDGNSPSISGIYKNNFSKFSIQPTIVNVDYLIQLCADHQNKTIWNFESDIPTDNDKEVSYYSVGDSRRGIYHFNSSIFPYIATAITKGKWNFSEYPVEIQDIVNEYKIDIHTRGVQ
jgi:hypothetical protein